MTFDSLTFVVFFIAVVAMFNLPGLSWSARKNLLLVASFVFYGAWNPPFLLLLIASASVDWWLALRMARARPEHRRPWLIVSLVGNLALLGFFKYGDFLRDNASALLALVGIEWQPAAFDILLPVGISFYTFHTLAYTIDLYNRKIPRAENLLHYSLYVLVFPQLVAGPIGRPHHLLPQLAENDSQAAALGYKHDAKKVDRKKFANYKPGQDCDDCSQWEGKKNDAWAPCKIFPGKTVNAKGWCAAFQPKKA